MKNASCDCQRIGCFHCDPCRECHHTECSCACAVCVSAMLTERVPCMCTGCVMARADIERRIIVIDLDELGRRT